ncbi:MAG: B12-binding domain-containing radical SAM protein [Planctomycetota bacterium]|jgi:radical SAM superfamily enzyme YgiQ (UPF0313 family)
MKVVLYKTLLRDRFRHERAYSLGLGYLKAHVEQHQPDVRVVVVPDAAQILPEEPDLIGLSCVTETWPATVELLRRLREDFGGPIVVGGSHVSALPRCLPPEADAGVVGEGEATLLAIVRHLKSGRRLGHSPLPGTVCRDADGEVAMGPSRERIPMDQLPFPEQEGVEIVGISTVRGCPFRCTHCVECRLFPKVRQLSARRLVEALVWYHERQGATKFEFLDDLFIAYPKRLHAFRDLLKERGLLGKFEFHRVSLCAHMCDEEVVKLLRQIGVVNSGIGVESAHPDILQAFKKGLVTVEHLSRAIRLAHKYGLHLGGSIVVGFPGESESQMRTTIDFVKRAGEQYGFELWTAFLCQPLPPSELWLRGLERGELSEEMDFSTLRIDGDMDCFDSPWYYGNEEALPRERFLEVMESEGFARPGRFIPRPAELPRAPRLAARR